MSDVFDSKPYCLKMNVLSKPWYVDAFVGFLNCFSSLYWHLTPVRYAISVCDYWQELKQSDVM